MNPRRNLQTRKNRRKRNERWLEKKCLAFLELLRSDCFMAARRCGKTQMTFELFKHRHGIVDTIKADGRDTEWVTIDFSMVPEDELDAMGRCHDE